MRRRSGRRPGDSGTREAIRAAAGRQFAELGYDRTSMRSVALEAGVDPGLVAHYFGTKHRLFVDVVELPFPREQVVPLIFAGPREDAGRRLADFLLRAFEDETARPRLVGLVRAAASEPAAAAMVRELLAREVFAGIIEALGVDDGDLRASLLGSQVMGLVMARYVVALEPLATLAPDRLAAALAPNLQRYLMGPLSD